MWWSVRGCGAMRLWFNMLKIKAFYEDERDCWQLAVCPEFFA